MPLIILILLVVAAAFFLRPKDRGTPHNAYFSQLQKELKENGPGHPALVLDLDRLDNNIATSQKYFNENKSFRVVAKSLPSLPLLEHICKEAGTNKLMVFHRPFLNLMVKHLPEAEFLLGKPFPIQAAKQFFKVLPKELDKQSTSDRIQWLVDSEARVKQYLELAEAENVKLKLSIEIDVGLHRGGLSSVTQLDTLLRIIEQNTDKLEFAGFMGYEPHIAKIPLGNTEKIERARQEAMEIYNRYVIRVRNNYPDLYHDDLTFNGAGSPTYQLYKNDKVLNDLCAGSSLVKPTDFDIQTLTGKEPALFIATPVIKKLSGTNVPFIEKFTPWIAKYNPNWQASIFTYGGYWKAKPCSPEGLSNNGLYGRSSNQEILTMSNRTQLQQDDYVFLRPTQSEAVMLEFSDLLVIRDGKIVDNWELFNQSIVKENH